MWLMCRWLGRGEGEKNNKNSRRLINKTKNLMSSAREGGRMEGKETKTDSDRDQQEIWKCTEYSVGCKQTKQRESKANEIGKGKERERAEQSGRASLN